MKTQTQCDGLARSPSCVSVCLYRQRIKFIANVNPSTMAPPACDRDYDRVYEAPWYLQLHRRTFYMTRILVFELLYHCTHRTSGIGVLSPDILLHILRFVPVCYS